MTTNSRDYLIFDDALRDVSLRPLFDACADAVRDGSARISKTRAMPGYPQYDCFRVEGREILVDAAFSYYLFQLGLSGFDYEKARGFTQRMIELAGFSFDVYSPLDEWIKRCIQTPYKAKMQNSPETYAIPEDYFKFACHIALCYLKYGASYQSVIAREIFDTLTKLGSDISEKLKKNGSGHLPREITDCKDEVLSCKANDAFATIKITLKKESEAHYERALDFLCRLLESEFPRSYSIGFKSPEKNYLPIKGLPKKGVHQLFANAARHPALHEKIERYARLAMKKDEWYNDLESGDCAMPGTFAVFALAMLDEKYAPLAVDYLALCDDEHSGIQGKFVTAFVEKFGLGDAGVRVFIAGADSMQELPPNKIHAQAAANEASLKRLLAAKETVDETLWGQVLYALWGKDAIYGKGAKTLKTAPPALRPLIERLLAKDCAS